MKRYRKASMLLAQLVLPAVLLPSVPSASAQTQSVFVPLSPACRILDTREPRGAVKRLQPRTRYTFNIDDLGVFDQAGNPTGCGIPHLNATAISANIYMLNPTAPGDVQVWAVNGSDVEPGVAAGVFNSQVPLNGSSTNIPVDSDLFYFEVDGTSSIDLVIDVSGYWVKSGFQTNIANGALSNAFSTASGRESIAMGDSSAASGDFSLAAGMGVTASAPYSTAFGVGSLASAYYSISMGYFTTASGEQSLALGSFADTNGFDYSFVFGDGSVETTNDAPQQFMVRANGGFKFFTSLDKTGVQLAPGAGSWTTLSDRNVKDAVEPIDARTILDQVVAMPLNTWHYKTQESRYRHMGPMAQDFYAAFHLGESDTGIDTIDADGVALAAIQGLNAKLAEKDNEIATLKLRVASLESLAGDLVEMKAELASLKHASTSNETLVAARPSNRVKGLR